MLLLNRFCSPRPKGTDNIHKPATFLAQVRHLLDCEGQGVYGSEAKLLRTAIIKRVLIINLRYMRSIVRFCWISRISNVWVRSRGLGDVVIRKSVESNTELSPQ